MFNLFTGTNPPLLTGKEPAGLNGLSRPVTYRSEFAKWAHATFLCPRNIGYSRRPLSVPRSCPFEKWKRNVQWEISASEGSFYRQAETSGSESSERISGRLAPMKLVIFGLTISSSWSNEHATIWPGLCRELIARRHDVAFFECDVPYYALTAICTSCWGTLYIYKAWTEILPLASRG